MIRMNLRVAIYGWELYLADAVLWEALQYFVEGEGVVRLVTSSSSQMRTPAAVFSLHQLR